MTIYGALNLNSLKPSWPVLVSKKNEILRVMKGKSVSDIKKMMGVSDAIASLNYERYQSFGMDDDGVLASYLRAPSDQFKMSAFVMDGPAYKGFDAISLSKEQYDCAQLTVRILSGLYGVLKPGDLIEEYRLEMGTKLDIGSSKNLYDFWSENVSECLNQELTNSSNRNKQKVKIILNLASQEYFKVISKSSFDSDVRFIDCVFKDKGKIASVYAKRARGLMARFAVTSGIASAVIDGTVTYEECVGRLSEFDVEGYCFQPTESSEGVLVFNRLKVPTKESVSSSSGAKVVDENVNNIDCKPSARKRSIKDIGSGSNDEVSKTKRSTTKRSVP